MREERFKNDCSRRLKICSAKSMFSRSGRTGRRRIRRNCAREFETATANPIGGNDLLIAAHAYAVGHHDRDRQSTDEFKRIRGLKVENWLA